jgi:pyridoxine 5-phosphate synthase
MNCKLSININKFATLRNARGKNLPDVILVARDCQTFGAEGITVHPRPDGRHIRYDDVYRLKEVVYTEFNIEGYPSQEFLDLVGEVKPTQVTLVPDPPDALTSNAGWDTEKYLHFLMDIASHFQGMGIRTSIFVNPEIKMIEYAQKTGCRRIELYTENYAASYSASPEKAIADYIQAAKTAHECGLEVNAGHDLNLENLRYFAAHIPHLKEVSIGHALICDALRYGLEQTVKLYLNLLQAGQSCQDNF